MQSTSSTILLVLALAFPASAQAAGSLLRVNCDGDDIGAEVLIDGAFKGECPLDIKLPEGTLTLRVQKPVDALRERVFEQRIRLGEGTVKSVEAVLGPAAFNAEGRRREAEHQAAEQAAQAEQRRRDDAALAQQQQAAAAGDGAAMTALGDRYASGTGVAKDDEQAHAWYLKAEAAGNALAAFKLWGQGRTTDKAQDVADVVRMLGLPAGPERQVLIDGPDQVRAFIATDPFFDVGAGGAQRVGYAYDVMRSTFKTHIDMACGRSGRFNEWEGHSVNEHNDATGKGVSVLGGLFNLEAKWSSGFLNSTKQQLIRVAKVDGQPFPLTAGQRFGFSIVTAAAGKSDEVTTRQVVCAVNGKRGKFTNRPQITEPVTPLICWRRASTATGFKYGDIRRYFWHESSGCFLSFNDIE